MPIVTTKQETYPHLMPDARFRESDYIASGRDESGEWGHGFPVEVSMVNLREGQKLYNIYCAICHGDSGNGAGVVAQERYGYPTIVSLLLSRIAEQPDGEIYNTIVNGKNTMGAYGSKLRVEERWKVVMYVRALQRAASGTVEDVPQEFRRELGL
jgi:cytochrome c